MKKVKAAAVMLLIIIAGLTEGARSSAANVSMKPEKYARDNHGAYTIQVSPAVRKKANKAHKKIRNSNAKHFYIKGKTTQELRAVMAYMSGRYLCYQVEDEWPDCDNVFRGTPGKYEVDLHPRLYRKLRQKDRYVRDIVTNAIRQLHIHTFMPEADAIKLVNDWIVRRVDYDWIGYNSDTIDIIWSAYKALKVGRCVCEGYADIFQIFMNELGIRAYRVESWDHIWNAVVLDGETEHIDVCWNDVDNSSKWMMLKLFPDHDPIEQIRDNRYVVFNEKRVFFNKKKDY